MIEGEQETLTATVVPPGSPVTWYSSSEAYATVDDNGVVTAVSPGVAIIIASITVDGVTYDDAAQVTVEAAPVEWEVVRDFTDETVWNDPELWLKLDYTAEDRRTYVVQNGEANTMDLIYDPSMPQSSLFFDSRAAVAGIEPDSNYDYALRISYDTDDGLDSNISTVGPNDSVFKADGWSGTSLLTYNKTGYAYLPLVVSNLLGERLISLQIRLYMDRADYTSASMELALVRKPVE